MVLSVPPAASAGTPRRRARSKGKRGAARTDPGSVAVGWEPHTWGLGSHPRHLHAASGQRTGPATPARPSFSSRPETPHLEPLSIDVPVIHQAWAPRTSQLSPLCQPVPWRMLSSVLVATQDGPPGAPSPVPAPHRDNAASPGVSERPAENRGSQACTCDAQTQSREEACSPRSMDSVTRSSGRGVTPRGPLLPARPGSTGTTQAGPRAHSPGSQASAPRADRGLQCSQVTEGRPRGGSCCREPLTHVSESELRRGPWTDAAFLSHSKGQTHFWGFCHLSYPT